MATKNEVAQAMITIGHWREAKTALLEVLRLLPELVEEQAITPDAEAEIAECVTGVYLDHAAEKAA